MRSVVSSLVLSFVFASAAVAFAEDKTTTLVFDAPPEGWKARPKEAKDFLVDFDLPAAEGEAEGPRANVLFYPMGFDDYRKKIAGSWKRADGTPLSEDDQKVETIETNGLKLRVVEQSGTHSPKHGAEQAGLKLVAVHIRAPGGKWTAWLRGPVKGVDKHRDAYLAWLKTGREVAAPRAEDTEAVRDVRFVHGAPDHGIPGPWELTAYRIGKHALAKLEVARGAADLVVTHRSPKAVHYTGMLDGLLAATGCTQGKQNLLHEPVEGEDALEVVVSSKASKRTLTYKLTSRFREKIRDIPTGGYPVMAKLLDAMKDDEVFTVVESQEK